MEFPNRRSIRLKGYDYSQSGYYFVTICSYKGECIFGEIVNNKMVLNDFGKIIKNVWCSLPSHHPVELDTFQIMPNHIHFLVGVVRAQPANDSGIARNDSGIARNDSGIARNDSGIARNAPTEHDYTGFGHVVAGSLPSIIRSFKSETAKQIRILKNYKYFPVWQRNYYEHIIRNENELYKIKEYIELNPVMWDRDKNNPKNIVL